MLGWESSTVVFASSTKRRTKASSVASSARICLTTSFFSKPPAPRNVAKKTRAMPPIAMGRSRTYLPKIWGNKGTTSVHLCGARGGLGGRGAGHGELGHDDRRRPEIGESDGDAAFRATRARLLGTHAVDLEQQGGARAPDLEGSVGGDSGIGRRRRRPRTPGFRAHHEGRPQLDRWQGRGVRLALDDDVPKGR